MRGLWPLSLRRFPRQGEGKHPKFPMQPGANRRRVLDRVSAKYPCSPDRLYQYAYLGTRRVHPCCGKGERAFHSSVAHVGWFYASMHKGRNRSASAAFRSASQSWAVRRVTATEERRWLPRNPREDCGLLPRARYGRTAHPLYIQRWTAGTSELSAGVRGVYQLRSDAASCSASCELDRSVRALQGRSKASRDPYRSIGHRCSSSALPPSLQTLSYHERL